MVKKGKEKTMPKKRRFIVRGLRRPSGEGEGGEGEGIYRIENTGFHPRYLFYLKPRGSFAFRSRFLLERGKERGGEKYRHPTSIARRVTDHGRHYFSGEKSNSRRPSKKREKEE